MATYVNDLRLKEIATGDESGTWGASTNTNLELIGEALGYGTQDCFSSDADATTTVADGATDPARAMYFKVTSSATLSATRTLTIAPNTVSRVMFIENATTGSQSIAISQGSGANVTSATGKTRSVNLDGAGSGAAVVDALGAIEDLIKTGTNASLTQLNITAQGDLRLEDSSGGQYVALQAASTVSSNVTFTLPTADGSANQVIKTDGSGALSFASVALPSTNVSFTQVDITAQGDLRLQDTTGGQYVALQAPSTVSSSVTFTMPGADGSASQVIKTDGSGNLGFLSAAELATNVSFTQVDITAQGDLRLQDGSGGEYVALQAPSTVSSNVTFTLPGADGSSGQVLKTDGSGALGWVSAYSAGSSAEFAQVDITAQGDLRLQDAAGGQYVALQAPTTVSSSYTYTLPSADGSSGQVLKTDGSGALGWISVNTPGGAAEFTQVDITTQGDLRLQDSSGGQYVGLQAPSTVSSSYVYTLPSADGSSGQFLTTNGSGALSWGSSTIADSSVTTAKLANDAVTQAKIGDDAVGADQLAASAVVTASMVDNAVTTAKITDSNVTTAKIATDAVTQAKIADDAVGADQLASSAVVTASIVDDAVTTAKIADDNVTSAKLAHTLDIVTSATFGGSSNGVAISQGAIALKNGGTQSKIDFYCESSNAHYTRLQAAPHSSYSGNITLTLPASDGDSGQVLTTDGSGVMSWSTVSSGAYNAWSIKTSAYTASSKDQLIVNSGSAVTITLPSSPSAGDTVIISNAGAGVVTVGRNSSNINSAAEDGTINQNGSAQLVYVDSTIGWFVI